MTLTFQRPPGYGKGGTVQGTDGNTYNIRATDEGAVAGNARGEYSVDLQQKRGAATQVARGYASTIAGGSLNGISSFASGCFIGAGSGNYIYRTNSGVIGGGTSNRMVQQNMRSFIGGGQSNTLEREAQFAVICGGRDNTIGEFTAYNVIGGGKGNQVVDDDANYNFIGGGKSNFIGGGDEDYPTEYGAIGGGRDNYIGGWYICQTIGGGDYNSTVGNYATVGGGQKNYAGSYTAPFATVTGGAYNDAYGAYSQAAGRRAKANHDGVFIWGDSTNADFASLQADEFAVRASGGVRFGPGDARVVIQAEDAAPTDAHLFNGSVVMYIDQSGNNLKFRVKYTDVTLKTGTLAVV